MNAKKIMGAVLVALLAAALFVGAGAAASGNDYGTVFVYQDLSGLGTIPTDWTLGASTITLVTVDGKPCFAGENIVEGTYKHGDDKITVKYPFATFSGMTNPPAGGSSYIIGNGGSFYDDGKTNATITAVSGNISVPVEGMLVTYPNGVTQKFILDDFFTWNITGQTGEYKINAMFDFYGNDFVTGTPDSIKISKNTFTFKVIQSDSVTISASTDTVVKTKSVKLTINGVPNIQYNVTGGDIRILSTGIADSEVDATGEIYGFVMPNTGKAIIDVQVNKTGEIRVKEGASEKASISITAVNGAITAAAEKDSYYIGNEIKLTGTSTVTGQLYLAIEGTNMEFQPLGTAAISVNEGKWDVKISGTTITGLNPDAGTYTVYIGTNKSAIDAKNKDGLKKDSYTTVSLILKQPFIAITSAPAIAVKETDYIVKGTAEAAEGIRYYVFGTNKFIQGIADVDKNQFEIEIKDTVTKDLSAGQYFLVVQHPMYDKKFNIKVLGNLDVQLYDSADVAVGQPLFNIDARQKTNAAQAFCDALDTQNIDDMYVKASFILAAPLSTINPLPAEITKGSKLTVSGTTNLGEGKIVTVEMLSTAFAAQPKETVGSAAFVALTTKTDKDGNWVVEFDTSSLNVDEYTVSVAVESLDSTSAKINVIEGAPVKPTETGTQPTQTEQPTQPTQTQTQPTTPPKTPGFGALAALAGLGAVAVLLLRRE